MTERMPQKCRHHQAAARSLGVGEDSDTLSELVYCEVLFCLLETRQRSRLLWITETMSESLITVQLTCSFCLSHKPDVPGLQLPRPSAHLYVYSGGTQVVKSQSQGHL